MNTTKTNKGLYDLEKHMTTPAKDYGCDPVGDGTFRLIPSGRIISAQEYLALFPPKTGNINDCVGLTWKEIERRQGGKLKYPGKVNIGRPLDS